MSFFYLTEKDILLLRETQYQLIYEPINKVLTGFLEFECGYQGYKIKDKYKLEIDFKNQQPLPLVKEINGRIETISKDKKIDLKNLHVNYGNMNKGLCLCSRFKAFEYANKSKNNLFSGIDFIQELIIPFLYGISYFEIKNKFPFGSLDHGNIGLIEEITNNKKYFKYLQIYLKTFPEEATDFIHKVIYKDNHLISEYICYSKLENVIYKNEKIGRNKLCPCGSGLKYKKCHLDIAKIISNFLLQKKYNKKFY